MSQLSKPGTAAYAKLPLPIPQPPSPRSLLLQWTFTASPNLPRKFILGYITTGLVDGADVVGGEVFALGGDVLPGAGTSDHRKDKDQVLPLPRYLIVFTCINDLQMDAIAARGAELQFNLYDGRILNTAGTNVRSHRWVGPSTFRAHFDILLRETSGKPF